MTLVDVNRHGGPTAPTLAKAEAGALEDPRPSTLSKFDVGLRWLPGSAASVYWGGDEPKTRQDVGKRAVLEPAGGAVALPLDRILAMMTTQAQLNDVIDGHSHEPIPSGEIRPLVDALNQHLSVIVGLYVTDLLERNHTKGGQPMQPLLEYAFAELLSAPVSADDPEKVEKLYRRWLLGRLESIDAELEASFRRRLRRRNHPREGADG
ncbi:hypothetical protein MHAE_15349 [Mycobacterium haemophilum DSM 44634]|uniref:Uncharacterized protein n=2 Tax=Mycobacterium haemophilum TaxID=29311 RepID=A0A0I9UP93_9MYCO|nr:hypothetical protein B586_09220 [Mycobacterium haemophilum DSM 44634]KLO30290.1 hypothetical protein ABH39_10645 [Mycobacterium haemophilum]KLO37369.1 hypothetical protein ABH38_08075 [Mycobacterium haemophilum]KLO43918.1 hypothetical protein ABH37_05600 [Mycobacterium haemophilum]KLO49663.1 hypothetical protein ABH36_11090 [Mycobacterium haemophilum]